MSHLSKLCFLPISLHTSNIKTKAMAISNLVHIGLIWKCNEISSLPKRFVPETCFTNQVRLVSSPLIFAFVLNDTSYNTRSFVLLIRYIPSLFMVTKDLSNPTIKTYTAYLIKNFQPQPWQLDACFELDAAQLCKILFYRYSIGLVNLTRVVFVLFLFELKIINSRS